MEWDPMSAPILLPSVIKPSYEWIWRFPKMGVTLNHPFDFRIFHCKPSSYWGTPMTKPPYGYGVYRNQPGYQLWDYYTILYHFEYFYTLLLLYTLLYTLLWDSYFYRNQPVYQPVIILGNLHISSPELLSWGTHRPGVFWKRRPAVSLVDGEVGVY